MKLGTIHLYSVIERADVQDDGSVLVGGYSFVNEVCEGEGGIVLSRKAMEEATADYEQWGTVRAMHQPIAAGVNESSIVWDEKGAYQTVRVVDENEVKKVKAGVYKGFSIGVRALSMRGKVVTRAKWIETSLVDRPKDPDALLTAFRSEDLDGEYEVEVLDDDVSRVDEGDSVLITKSKFHDCGCESGCEACNLTLRVQKHKDEAQPEVDDAEEEIRRVLDATKTCPDCEGCEGGCVKAVADAPEDVQPVVSVDRVEVDLSRVEVLESELSLVRVQAEDLIQRLSNTEADLSRVQGLLTAAEEEVKRMKKTPAGPMPVRYSAAHERTFAINRANVNPETATLANELTELERSLPTETDEAKRQDGAVRMLQIKQQLFGKG